MIYLSNNVVQRKAGQPVNAIFAMSAFAEDIVADARSAVVLADTDALIRERCDYLKHK